MKITILEKLYVYAIGYQSSSNSKGCIDFNSEYLQGPAVTVSWQWCVTREIQQVMDGAECWDRSTATQSCDQDQEIHNQSFQSHENTTSKQNY